MRADWTRPDARISDYLARNGRFGIPMNAVYGPGAPRGVLLSEVLTRDAVLDALREARGPARLSAR
jgi:suppressor for copper-sensitivity B